MLTLREFGLSGMRELEGTVMLMHRAEMGGSKEGKHSDGNCLWKRSSLMSPWALLGRDVSPAAGFVTPSLSAAASSRSQTSLVHPPVARGCRRKSLCRIKATVHIPRVFTAAQNPSYPPHPRSSTVSEVNRVMSQFFGIFSKMMFLFHFKMMDLMAINTVIVEEKALWWKRRKSHWF